MKEDKKEELKKIHEERESFREILKMMNTISYKSEIAYIIVDTDLSMLITDIGKNLRNLEDKQIKELTNMLEQFYKLLNDYLKENHIEIERL